MARCQLILRWRRRTPRICLTCILRTVKNIGVKRPFAGVSWDIRTRVCRNRRDCDQRGQWRRNHQHVGIALTFGLVVLAMIYTVGDISGRAFESGRDGWLLGGAPNAGKAKCCRHITNSQVCVAQSAPAGCFDFFFHKSNCSAQLCPPVPEMQSFILETILTFFLMLTILVNVSIGAKEKGITAGIAVGAVIALEAMFAGPICGASMNPARSLAPWRLPRERHFEHLWIYLVAPPLGACAAMFACRCVREEGCCAGN